MIRSALPGAAVAGLAFSLSACVSNVPPTDLIPAGPAVTRMEDLSGDYCYVGPEANVRSYRRGPVFIPFVDVPALATPGVVSVQATKERVAIVFTRSDGTEEERVFGPGKAGAVWRKNALVISSGSGGGSMHSDNYGFTTDLGGHSESRLSRLKDGRLVMSDSFRRKTYSSPPGGQNFVFIVDEYLVAVILDPAIGECGQDAKGRPAQPWFGRGPNLRDPACASRFEEQVTAILVDQGEAPENAALFAGDALQSGIGGAWSRDFYVSSWSGATYRFEVAKMGSGGVLRLFERQNQNGSLLNTLSYIATRPLPECACND